MQPPDQMRNVLRPLPLTGKLAVVCLLVAAATVLRAGENFDEAATAHRVPTNSTFAGRSPTNALLLWIDIPTNATRSDILTHTALASTNCWLPGAGSALATSSTWRTTVTIETGFFHARNGGWPACPGEGHRSANGWFQEVGVSAVRALDPADPSFTVGFGVSVGWLKFR